MGLGSTEVLVRRLIDPKRIHQMGQVSDGELAVHHGAHHLYYFPCAHCDPLCLRQIQNSKYEIPNKFQKSMTKIQNALRILYLNLIIIWNFVLRA
jgi:hypothetical protein